MPDSKPSSTSFKDQPLHTSSKLSAKDKNGHPETSLNTTGKKMSAAGALLKDKHPELFLVAPRPGGFVRNITPTRRDPSKTTVQEGDEKPQRKRPMAIGSATRPVSITDVLETRIPCPAFHRLSKDEERNNMVRMCSVAISTVIMLAQHSYKDISLEHVRHTEEYFRALRQEDGYPQNIGQLMQVLANLKRAGKIVSLPPDDEDSDDDEEDNEDIQISDIIN